MREERGLAGLEARTPDGAVVGRISEVLADGDSGEVTHVMVESEEEVLEVPISSLSLDPYADFATFHADASDEEPGDHVDDEELPQGYAPSESEVDDAPHEGQFVTAPTDPDEAISPEEAQRDPAEAGGWEDEASTTADSGYPRNDVYIDPETGDEDLDPALKDNESLADDAADLVTGTELSVRAAKDGVVELTGRAASREQLEGLVGEIQGLTEVLDVDVTDVEVG